VTDVGFEADDLHAALVKWISDDISESPRQGHDLGKFFFTVSIGTVGAVTAMIKTPSGVDLSMAFVTFLGLSLLSLLIALWMVLPRVKKVSREFQMQDEHPRHVHWVVGLSWAWFAAWLASVAFAIVGLAN
jgi:hypothetical protein